MSGIITGCNGCCTVTEVTVSISKLQVILTMIMLPQRLLHRRSVKTTKKKRHLRVGKDIEVCCNNRGPEVTQQQQSEHQPDVKAIRKILLDKGLGTYLESSLGGEVNATSIKTLILRIADLLCWTYGFQYKQPLEPGNVLSWMCSFIKKQFKLIVQYINYLDTNRMRTPSTILHVLNDIKKTVIWYLSFRDEESDKQYEQSLHIERVDIDPLFNIIKSMTRNINKKMKKDRGSKRRNTLAGIVFDMQLPASGLKGLVEAVRGELSWVTPFVAKLKTTDEWSLLVKEDYDFFMQTLFAALYVFTPQGRVGGIADLTCFQGQEMVQHGFTQSQTFKTSATYGYQPVMIGDLSGILMREYLYTVRPIIAGRKSEETPKDPLWIEYNGVKTINTTISHRVTGYIIIIIYIYPLIQNVAFF